jgi:hypothetical protein
LASRQLSPHTKHSKKLLNARCISCIRGRKFFLVFVGVGLLVEPLLVGRVVGCVEELLQAGSRERNRLAVEARILRKIQREKFFFTHAK